MTMPEFNIKEYLTDDKELQKEYIKEVLALYIEDNDLSAFAACIKPLIKMQGSIKDFAIKTGLNRTYLYKIFNNQIKPDFSTIILIIKNIGFDFEFNLKIA